MRPFGAVAWLAQETGVRRDTIEKLLAGKLTQMGLGSADALLVAVGKQHEIDCSVPVHGNPHGSIRFARARTYQRVTYSAEIQLGGETVGRVRRFRSATHYLAFDESGRIVANASNLPRLRRELVRRGVQDAYCCGGSMTGSATPRPQRNSLNGSF